MPAPQPVQRVALYVRPYDASKACEQCAETADAEAQLDLLRRYCAQRGWAVVAEYADGARAPAGRRPERKRLFEDAQRGLFDLVAVACLRPLAGSLSDLLRFLERLRRLDTAFVAVKENLDTTTAEGRAMFRLIELLAGLDRAWAGERARRAAERAQRRGTRSGRPIGRPRRSVDSARALELRRQGYSLRQISQRMGVPVTTLHARLKEWRQHETA